MILSFNFEFLKAMIYFKDVIQGYTISSEFYNLSVY